MRDLIGFSTGVVLFLLSVLHVYWACGGRRGAHLTIAEQDGKPRFEPTPAATVVVAVLLLLSALVVWGRTGLWGPAILQRLFGTGTWALAVIFLARALGDFRWFGFFKRIRNTPFSRWDTWLYSPLCLVLSIGCAVVGNPSEM